MATGNCVKTSLIVLISLVMSFLQTGCSLKINNQNMNTAEAKIRDIGDGGFLSAEPCGPPCFFEIVPGTTTKNQAISMLQASELYVNCQEYDNRKQGGVRGIACQTVSLGLQNDFDIVESIGFKPTQTITVEKVIAKYGEPSAVLVTAVSYTDNEFVTSMILYYDTLNVELVLAEQNSGEFKLAPTTTVENIGYSDRNSYNQSRKYFQDWKGYGNYRQWNP